MSLCLHINPTPQSIVTTLSKCHMFTTLARFAEGNDVLGPPRALTWIVSPPVCRVKVPHLPQLTIKIVLHTATSSLSLGLPCPCDLTNLRAVSLFASKIILVAPVSVDSVFRSWLLPASLCETLLFFLFYSHGILYCKCQ